MKKKIAIMLSMLLVLNIFTACGTTESQNNSDRLSIVTTIFPEYDWVKQITDGRDVDITMLLNNGVDLHSYQPSAEDIVKISNCDVFVYVGGESDAWVEDALKESVNEKRVEINLMDVLGKSVKEEELAPGMQDEDEGGKTEDENEIEYDEHVWLSLKNAVAFCTEIKNALVKIDPSNTKIYEDNAETYIEKLNELDKKYSEAVKKAGLKTLLFADRFPFRYLVDDYGLKYYAAFLGCSAESEASFETIAFLAKQIDKYGLNVILTLEGTDHSIAETVITTSKKKAVQIKSMNSMQSTTSEDVDAGATYLSIMEENLNVLTEALK